MLTRCLADLLGGSAPPHDVVLTEPRGNGKTVRLAARESLHRLGYIWSPPGHLPPVTWVAAERPRHTPSIAGGVTPSARATFAVRSQVDGSIVMASLRSTSARASGSPG